MKQLLFIASVLCLTAAMCAEANAQTAPAGQLSRQIGRKLEHNVSPQSVLANAGANTPITAAVLAQNMATIKTDLKDAENGAAPPVTEGPAPVTAAGVAAKSKALDAVVAWAKAEADDAKSFSDKAHDLLAADQKNASSPADFEVLAEKAHFVDQAVTAADLADGFHTLAEKQTGLESARYYATRAHQAAAISHLAYSSYLGGRKVGEKGCVVTSFSDGKPSYTYQIWFPLAHSGCTDAAVLYYYNVGHTATVAKQAQFIYNAAQSTNQVNADLLTSTFPGGFQVVLAGTATSGSSTPNTAAGGSTPATGTTESVDTAVARLQQGGDFNVRFAYPIASYSGSRGGFQISMFPNLGFSVNGLSSQNTITESTEYSGNIPVEFYGEFGSIPNSGTAAILFLDAKIGGEFVTPDFATKIGTPKSFFLGQFAAGIEFAKSVRIGFQYFMGPKQAYCQANSSGGCTAVTGGMSGIHLVTSFTPPPSK